MLSINKNPDAIELIESNLDKLTNWDLLCENPNTIRILEKYPDRVPLIIQPSKNDRDSYPIDKSKYITPRDLTLLQLQQIIRKRIRFPAEKGCCNSNKCSSCIDLPRVRLAKFCWA